MEELTVRKYNRGKERCCTSCVSFDIIKFDDRLKFECSRHGIKIKPEYTCDENVRADYDIVIDKAYFLADHYHLRED